MTPREQIEQEMLKDGATWQERHYPIPFWITGYPGTVHDSDTTANKHYPNARRVVDALAAERVIAAKDAEIERLKKINEQALGVGMTQYALVREWQGKAEAAEKERDSLRERVRELEQRPISVEYNELTERHRDRLDRFASALSAQWAYPEPDTVIECTVRMLAAIDAHCAKREEK